MSKRNYIFSFLFILFLTLSCESNRGKILFIDTPCKDGGMPNLHITSSDEPILSWIEFVNDSTDALVHSILRNNEWTPPQVVAYGSDWFVNWADFPSLVSYPNQDIWTAHWLQKSATGTYDYDIKMVQSFDTGKTWGKSFSLNQDGVAAEHGFVTLLPIANNAVFATWLDGRYTKTENGSDGHEEGHSGAMTLRAAFIHPNNTISHDIELDDRVCDCCQTAAALTTKGVVVAYRDRLEGEIRDISIVRQNGMEWTTPKTIHNDNWETTSCPVNGPAVVADGEQVAVAWFTRAQDTAKVQVAFSEDAGDTFSSPIRVDEGNPLGRVGLVFVEGRVIVSWLENRANEAVILLQQVSQEGKIGISQKVTSTSAARASGFPIIREVKNQLLVAWTEVQTEEKTVVRTALLPISIEHSVEQ